MLTFGPVQFRPSTLTLISPMSKLTKLAVRDCDVESLRGLNQIPFLDVLTVTSCEGLTRQGLSDLLPCRLSSLIIGSDSRDLLEDGWGTFVQALRLTNMWVDIIVQEAITNTF